MSEPKRFDGPDCERFRSFYHVYTISEDDQQWCHEHAAVCELHGLFLKLMYEAAWIGIQRFRELVLQAQKEPHPDGEQGNPPTAHRNKEQP